MIRTKKFENLPQITSISPSGKIVVTENGVDKVISFEDFSNLPPASEVWNNASTTFTASEVNVTDIQSAADSKLLDLKVNTVSKFVVRKDGNLGIGVTNPAARLDISDTVLAGSGSLAGSALNLAQTWNTTGNPTAIKLNVTNTASGANSNILDFQIGGVSKFKINKDGNIGINISSIPTNLLHIDCTLNKGILLTNSTQAPNRANFYINAGTGGAYNAFNISESYDNVLYSILQTYQRSIFLGGFANLLSTASVTILNDQDKSDLLQLRKGLVGSSTVFKVSKGGSVFSGAAIGTNAGNPGADGLSFEMFFAGYGMGTNTHGDAVFYQNNVARTRVGFGVAIANTHSLGFTDANHVGTGVTVDTAIFRDIAGVLAQRNGVNPQAFRLYNTYTDATTFERLNIKWDTNVLKLGTEKGGSGGTARAMELQTDATTRMTVTSTGSIGIGTTSPNYLFSVKPNSGQIGQIGFSTLPAFASPALYLEDYSGNTIYKFGQDNSGALKLLNNGNGVCLETTGAYTTIAGNGTFIQAGNSTVTIQGNYGKILLDAFTNNAIQFFAGTAMPERMRILGSNGNVGIGTTTPLSPLHISSGVNSNIYLASTTNNAGIHEIRFGFHTINSYAASIVGITTGSGGRGNLEFRVAGGGDATNAIQSDTGIRITSADVQVLKPLVYAQDILAIGINHNSGVKAFKFTRTENKAAIWSVPVGSQGNGDIRFTTGNDANSTPKTENDATVIISKNGGLVIGNSYINEYPTNGNLLVQNNIGIGTTTSLAKLDIAETWNSNISVTGASGTGSVATITFATQSTVIPVGSTIVVANVNPAGYNGTFVVTASSTTSVSYANATTTTYVSSGTVQQLFTAVKVNVTNTASGGGSNLLDLQLGGVSKFKVLKEGVLFLGTVEIGSTAIYGAPLGWPGSPSWGGIQQLNMYSGSATTGFIQWNNDLFLYRDAANTLAQRNGVNPQAFRLYGTYTDASNYARLAISCDTSGNAILATEGLGTGAAGSISINGLLLGIGAGNVSSNVAIGPLSLPVNTTGSYNTAVGRATLNKNTTGYYNTAVGNGASFNNTTGYQNSAIGESALGTNATGALNVAIGYLAGYYTSTGQNTVTNYSIFIGTDSKALGSSQTNQIVIGSSAVGIGSNSVVLGNDSILTTALKGSVGIGTTTPSNKLEVVGGTVLFGNAADTTGTSQNGDLTLRAYQFPQLKLIANIHTGSDFFGLKLQLNDTLLGGILLNIPTGEIKIGGFWNGGYFPTFYSNNAEVMRISASGNVGIGTTTPAAKLDILNTTLAGSGSLAGSVLNLAQTWNTTGAPTAIKLNVTNTASGAASNLLDLQVGGASQFSVNKNGVAQFGPTSSRAILFDANGGIGVNRADVSMTTALVYLGFNTAPRITIVSGGTIGWSQSQNDTAGGNATPDTVLLRDGAANILALRNGVNPQTFRLYNTYTDANTFERLNIKWDTNVLKIGTEKGTSGGTVRAMEFQTDGTTRMTFPATGGLSLPNGSDINFGGAFNFYGTTSSTTINGPTSFGQVGISINGSDKWIFKYDGLFCGGGTTSSFPALKRNGAAIQIRLADDSANAALETAGLTVVGSASVSGHFSATTKSFLIPHPTKPDKKLQYACLEGPENGVYIRGKTNEPIILLPDYWSELVDADSITVTVTPIGKPQQLFVVSQNSTSVEIGNVDGLYNYLIFAERKDVNKLQTEI